MLEALDGLDLDVRTGKTTSVVARLTGGRPGPTILLRADMDALPMPEEPGLSFASEVGGAVHACGHDAHTAMLVGAARLLACRRESLAGSVVFMFQPGEEGYHGAVALRFLEQRAPGRHVGPPEASGESRSGPGSPGRDERGGLGGPC